LRGLSLGKRYVVGGEGFDSRENRGAMLREGTMVHQHADGAGEEARHMSAGRQAVTGLAELAAVQRHREKAPHSLRRGFIIFRGR
jgi:hypothetical protein